MKKYAGIIYVCLITLLSVSPLFCEVGHGNSSFNFNIFSKQFISNHDTPLNPHNIFDIRNGYYGDGDYTLGMSWSNNKASIVLNDFGTIQIPDTDSFRNSISELYLSYAFLCGFVDLGKKRINQSLSYFKSPINFALDKTNRYDLRFSEGRVMSNIDLFTNFGFIGISYIPQLNVNENVERYISSSQNQQYLFRYDHSVCSFNVGIAATYEQAWRTGVHFSRSLGNNMEVHCEYVFNENKMTSDFTVYNEIIDVTQRDNRDVSEGVIGFTLNTSLLSGIFEYYVNQSGYSYDEWKNKRNTYKELSASDNTHPLYYYNLANAYRSLIDNAFSANSKHYIMLRLSNPAGNDVDLSLNTIINMQDFSGRLLSACSYLGWEHIALETGLCVAFGETYTEFRMLGESLLLSFVVEFFL